MNEAETRAEHMDPALKAAGWGVVEGVAQAKAYAEKKQIRFTFSTNGQGI